ncbi:MAG: PAS domain-containing protein [Gammaproteobacteria bacterium]|nr:MAG: PAS domain-containing protein [Gammaproteobacteria bacterium]
MSVTARLPEVATHQSWRDQLELLLASTGEGIYGVDLDGRCVFINRAGAEILGYRPGQVLGRNMHDLMHHTRADGSHYPVDECPIYQAFRQGESCRLDCDVLWRADGSHFHAEYSSYPIRDGDRIIGAVVTFVDVSERKHAEELLKRAHDELERRVAERTQELTDALAEVARTNERLRRLSAHLQTVREDERSRIAREIHDELGSVLVALKLDVGWLKTRLAAQPELVAKTASMAGLIDTAVTEVGRIITDLRPSILDHQGLWAALEWHAQEFLQATGLRGGLELRIEPEAPAPDGALATGTYRIFQEILNNVARHANATAVEMRVSADARGLVIRVRDNGRGITLEHLRHPDAHGVLGMSERARHFGGRLAIGPAASGGTRVRVWLPLSHEQGDTNDPAADL